MVTSHKLYHPMQREVVARHSSVHVVHGLHTLHMADMFGGLPLPIGLSNTRIGCLEVRRAFCTQTCHLCSIPCMLIATAMSRQCVS